MRKRKAGGPLGRKAERKAEREVAKRRKAQFFAKKPEQPSARKLDGNEQPSKRRRIESAPDDRRAPRVLQKQAELSQSAIKSPKSNSAKLRGKERETDPQNPARKKAEVVPPSKQRSLREEAENAYAALLERKLGLDKRKKGKNKYGAEFESDGLLGEPTFMAFMQFCIKWHNVQTFSMIWKRISFRI